MKKFLAIFILAFLFSGNANAGVNETGSGPIFGKTLENVKKIHKEHLPKAKKKKKHMIYYVSINNEFNSWAGWAFYAKKINKNSHEKAYKKCMEYAAEYTQKDCFLFSIDDKIVWNLEGPVKLVGAEMKAEIEKQAQIDKKPGRFFEDQPDVNDDYQIHFNYLLALDSEDREWDINGKMEEILLEMNEKMLKATARHKYSGGVAKKYKFDFRKDGKLDITFVRVDKRRKQLPHHPNGYFKTFLYNEIKMKNPKKIYYNFADINHPTDGGEAGVPMGSSFLKNKHVKNKKKTILITLHELHHAQGGGFACVPGMGDDGHYKIEKDGYQLTAGTRLGATYIHKVEGCPELVDSVYLTPTSEQPYDPYELICKKKLGKYNHPKANIGSNCKWVFVPGNYG